ncbi:alpha/beta hydrolase [Lactobacillus melliventris]|uniref:alpha/beta hydrolase fold domain-containing protein n=1 Tax=Lactobacillus melliventris TaxID=1218507 RepID=UPI001580199D|nr:alpha/beta hydrolase fold domain-containing protein [Lactobacillus melliventris]NUE97975.1 alpha/beta hydrolase [Lactobacillus melliventris]
MTQIITDVTYDKQRKLQTDIYQPDNSNSNDILLFWHGGGWFRGDKSSFKDLCGKIADQGFTVFAPNYSLAPQHLFPAAHQDSINFVEWLLKTDFVNHKKLSITQIGASSGGTMALKIAGKYGFPTVTWSAPVSYSAWMKNHQDVTPAVDGRKELGLSDLHDINNAFYKYFTLAYAGSKDEAILKKMDAKSYDYTNLHQLLMINSADELSPTSYLLDFINYLAQNNHAVDLKIISGTKHAMSYANQYLECSLNYLLQAIK